MHQKVIFKDGRKRTTCSKHAAVDTARHTRPQPRASGPEHRKPLRPTRSLLQGHSMFHLVSSACQYKLVLLPSKVNECTYNPGLRIASAPRCKAILWECVRRLACPERVIRHLPSLTTEQFSLSYRWRYYISSRGSVRVLKKIIPWRSYLL